MRFGVFGAHRKGRPSQSLEPIPDKFTMVTVSEREKFRGNDREILSSIDYHIRFIRLSCPRQLHIFLSCTS